MLTERSRLLGLDGIRGIAALFVVIHHSWLMAFPGFPRDNGPVGLQWMMYGHFAVVIFIALSGFSLAVSPVRSGWRLSGLWTFARRRAWRILPPYWAALVFSLAIAWTIAPQPGEGVPDAKAVVTYGLLVQDLSGAHSPNGAFWSIAVEAQLYFVFPLLLFMVREGGKAIMLIAVAAPVITVGALATRFHPVYELMRLTPQFAVLFATGAAAAGIIAAADRWRRVPWIWPALGCLLPVAVLIHVAGPAWTVGHFFWVDLALAPAIGLLLTAVATGRPRPLVRLLDTRPLRGLGSFSYSLYLIHAPIVVVVAEKLVAPHTDSALATLGWTLAISVPVSLVTARLFAAVFELPFQRHRSFAALKASLRKDRAVREPAQRDLAGT